MIYGRPRVDFLLNKNGKFITVCPFSSHLMAATVNVVLYSRMAYFAGR